MRLIKPVLLSLIILTLAGGLVYAKNNKGKMKHSGVDRNNDGVVTRAEWRGNNRSFNNQDWNGDGILSGDEVWPGARQQWTGSDRFSELDDNSNGFVSRGEWNNTSRSFERLDRNNDGRLNRDEFYNRSQMSLIDEVFQDIFRGQ